MSAAYALEPAAESTNEGFAPENTVSISRPLRSWPYYVSSLRPVLNYLRLERRRNGEATQTTEGKA